MVALRSINCVDSGRYRAYRMISDHRCGGSAGLPDFPFTLYLPHRGRNRHHYSGRGMYGAGRGLSILPERPWRRAWPSPCLRAS